MYGIFNMKTMFCPQININVYIVLHKMAVATLNLTLPNELTYKSTENASIWISN